MAGLVWSRERELRSARIVEFTRSPSTIVALDGAARLSVTVRTVVAYWPFGQGGAEPSYPLTSVDAELTLRSAVVFRRPVVPVARVIGREHLRWGESWAVPPHRPLPVDREVLLEMPACASFTLPVPPLWPGPLIIGCRIVHTWPPPGAAPALSPPAEASLTVQEPSAVPTAAPPALWATTLIASIIGPGPGLAQIGSANFPFRLETIGVPTLVPQPAAGHAGLTSYDRFAAITLAAALDRALHAENLDAGTLVLLLPVRRHDGPLAGDPANALRYLRAAQGAMASALRTDDQVRSREGFLQAGHTATEAARFDPNHLEAWVVAAQAFALAADLDRSAEIFLTLVLRLRAAERVLTNGTQHPSTGTWWEAVASACRGHATLTFWGAFDQTAELQRLSVGPLDLAFPRLRSLAGRRT